MTLTPRDSGWIEVICGSMFSGKTEELIRRLKRAEIAQMKVEIYKPKIDSRYSVEHIVSHNQLKMKSIMVNTASDILEQSKDADVVGIDEAQFFGDDLVQVCHILAKNKKRVVVAGLDTDYKGNPFGPMPNIMCEADYLDKLSIFKDSEADAGVVIFKSVHPRWSYVKVGNNGNVTESAEKKPISNSATAGFYLYKKASMFVEYAKQMIMKDANLDGYFYICPVFNEMILEQKIIKTFTIQPQQYHSFMSPEMLIDYKDFLDRKEF